MSTYFIIIYLCSFYEYSCKITITIFINLYLDNLEKNVYFTIKAKFATIIDLQYVPILPQNSKNKFYFAHISHILLKGMGFDTKYQKSYF